MFTARNKTTGEVVSSTVAKLDSLYSEVDQHDWYADPNNIEDAGDVEDITKIPVTFVDEKEYPRNGKTIFVSPYFMIPGKSDQKIVVKKESEQHKQAKQLIYNLLRNPEFDIELCINKITKPYQHWTKTKISELDIDYRKISVEPHIHKKEPVRIDVLLPFKNKHNELNRGIAIEVQFSKQSEKEEEKRTRQRVTTGFSVVWMKPHHFFIDGEQILLNTKQLHVIPYTNKILEIYEEVKEKFVEQRTLLRKEQLARDDELKRRRPEIYGPCECGGHLEIRKNKDTGNLFYGCSNYFKKGCTNTISITELNDFWVKDEYRIKGDLYD